MKFSLVVLSLFISPEVFARPMARNRNVGKLRTPRSPRRNSRVMGGKDADIKDYPYAISLRKAEKNGNFKHNCGGSLVSNLHIITAAHCVFRESPNQFEIEVGVQDTRDSISKRVYKIDSIVVHPKYKGRTNDDNWKNGMIDNDIAIITLERPIESSEFAEPIELLEGKEIPATSGLIVGWGAKSGKPLSDPTYNLNEAEMPIRSNEDCDDMLNTVRNHFKRTVTIKEGHLCAGYDEGGIDGCQGDSGAGLVVRNGRKMELVGIMSAGIACGRPLKPGVYTRISEYKDWITDHMQ